MDDKGAALVLGTLMFLGVGVFFGVVTMGQQDSSVGGTPRFNDVTRWPDEDRGRGTTNYSGGTGGFGINLGLNLGAGPTCDPDGQKHGYRYPASSGEVLEALMYGPGLVKPPMPIERRNWLYKPPSRDE